MNTKEAKRILITYRPGTDEAGDTEVSAALELARQDAELGRWLAEHLARQEAIRDKFRQIAPPAGLKEQILSEHAASRRRKVRPSSGLLIGAAALFAILLAGLLALHTPGDQALVAYRNRMVSRALRPYSMNLISSEVPKVLDYLKQQQAPADLTLPSALAKNALVGCATPKWADHKVSMLCFRTGRPLPRGEQSDLWLFVIDEKALPEAPKPGPPVFTRVNKLTTAMWTSGHKTYLLGVAGDEAYLRTFL